MKIDEYFLLVAYSYLRSSEQLAPKIAGKLKKSHYDYLTPRIPGKFSVGAMTDKGESIGFFGWADPLREEGILSLSISKINPQTSVTNPIDEKIAASFVGGVLETLSIATKKGIHPFVLVPVLSPRYRADVEDFISLVDEQENPPLLWEQCKNQIVEFLTMNSAAVDPEASAKELLRETPSTGLWEPLGDSLFRELQVNLTADGKKLHLNKALSALVQEFSETFGDDRDDDYVYFYKEKDVDPDMLAELIEAQPDSAALLDKIQEFLNEEEPSFKFRFNHQDWKKGLKIMTAEEFDNLVGWVSRAISEVCTREKKKPVIPSSQISHWGPSPAELLRIRAREKLQKSGYYLAPFEDPWQFYAFKELPPSVFNPVSQRPLEPFETLPGYRIALKNLVPFAQKIASPFEEAFRLADFILDHSSEVEAGILVAQTKVKNAGFSELALEIFAEKAQMTDELREMLFESDEIAALLSLEVSDIFGGMGSWSDQYFSDEALQREFEKLSDALYSSRNALFQSILHYNSGS